MSRNRQSSAVNGSDFQVVGIGASAGGLEAFTTLVKALPPDTGMAFVLVQHMDPTHESLLYQLLSRATVIPVSQIADGMRLEPNRIYLIPPNRDLTVDRGVLRLGNLRAMHMSIDTFFTSLATDRREKAIGVILSGTASDGTHGLKAIKDFGGITFAQDEKSAKYAGMPTSAVASGYVDFVLPPQQIARELQQLAHRGAADSEALSKLPDDSGALKTIFRLLAAATDVDFSLYKLATIKRRIRRRMILREIPDFDRYARYLESHPSEIRDLFDSILIRVTEFFREPKTFQGLRNTVFPKIVAEGRKTNSIRIWVPGCCTGEEVYSIAIGLLEYLDDRAVPKIQIFGTDLNQSAIQVARSGLYADSAIRNVSRNRLRRFFVEAEGGYQVVQAIRESCIFSYHDLAKDPPFAKLDLISCQNVFIYLGTALQRRILAGFHYALKPTGYLALGESEVPEDYTNSFALEDQKNKIFWPKPVGVRHFLPSPTPSSENIHPLVPVPAPSVAPTADLVEEARRILLERYSAPAFIVDSDLNIVHFQGDTSPFIKPSTGAVSFNLLKMLRPEFAVDVRSLLDRASKDGVPGRKEGIELEQVVLPKHVVMEVVPFHAPNVAAPAFMVLFLKMEPSPQQSSEVDLERGRIREDPRQVETLRRELAATQKSLLSITEDHEATNEALRTANEEVRTSNEELLSTNQELETAKEELQSSNEELHTLNDELHNRNVELSAFAEELSSLLTGVNIPILVLDSGLRIRRFTPAAQRVFNLIPSDLGRPFGDISSSFKGPDWNNLISRVTDELGTVETEITGPNGRWYSLRMRSYSNRESKTDGVLIALLDVDALKRQLGQNKESLETTQELYRLVSESAHDLVGLHSADSKYIYVSPSREKLLGYTIEETIGKSPVEFCHPDDRKLVTDAFKGVLRSRTSRQVSYRVMTKDGRELWLEALITPIPDDAGKITRLQTVARDITERKENDDKLREGEHTVRALLEAASQAILVVDRAGKVVLTNRMAEKVFGYEKHEFLEMDYMNVIPQHLRARHALNHKRFFLKPRKRPMGLDVNLLGLRKNGEQFPVEISLSYIDAKQGTLAVAFVTDVSEREETQARLHQTNERLVALSGRLMSAKDEESKRIARDLHDIFAQELAALATESKLLKRELPPAAKGVATKIDSFAQRISRLATDIQRMSRGLHPALLDHLGLSVVLQSECTAFSQRYQIEADFSSTRVPRSITGDVALCLYRVAQEGLQNVAKHSGSKKVHVDLALKRGEIHLTIQDLGKGFDLHAHRRKMGGLGLTSMEERMRLAGGSLAIDAKPGNGTRILARVPLKKE